jgi:catechol 2,3-dioxygenase-like lactoylglutathione lyase family enzyme
MAHIGLVTLVVRDYDEAIDFYLRAVGFNVVEDTVLDEHKRWVVLAPPGASETGLLLARAVTGAQRERIGDQTGGRVGLFLMTGDLDRDYHRMRRAGVRFAEPPRHEPDGTVAVFEDLYGNRRDLIQGSETAGSPQRGRERQGGGGGTVRKAGGGGSTRCRTRPGGARQPGRSPSRTTGRPSSGWRADR